MKNKKISAIILATTLSFAGVSYAVAGNQQGMKHNQNCKNQSGEMKDNQYCSNQSSGMKNKQNGKNQFGSMKKGNRHGNNHQKMAFSQLDLNADQKQIIDDIMAGAKAENQKSRVAHRASMQAIMNNATFDEDAAKALMSQQQVQKEEKRLTMMEAKHQAFQLLTDEQKTQYNELKVKRQNR